MPDLTIKSLAISDASTHVSSIYDFDANITVDSEPVEGSHNAVTSGSVYNIIGDLSSFYAN